MTSEELLAYRATWEVELAKQRPHAVYLPVRVRWDLPWDSRGAVVELGQRVGVDESSLEATTDEARRDPWTDPSFVLDRRFVEWPGCELRTPEGVPMVPWGSQAQDGQSIKPLTLLMRARQTLCEGTEKDPFSGGWFSEGYRALFIEMCRLRLARPGEVLELLELGGNRAGKTYGMILCAVANWKMAPRPEGTDYGPQWKGQSLIMHSGELTSASEHQVPFYYLMPKSIRDQARSAAGGSRMKKTEDTVFNFSGTGFPNGSFNLPIESVHPEDGATRLAGGEVRFRSYNGSPNTYEGPEYNLIQMDEEVSITVYENMKRGMTSRAVVTNEQWFLDAIQQLLSLLEAGTPMTQVSRELLGLLFQSWLIAMFTPVSGFTQLVRVKLQGLKPSDMYGWYHSPVLASLAGVPVDRKTAGGDKRQVPQFAKPPTNPNQLIAWYHTRWNCMKPAVRTLLNTYKASGWKEVRKRLYGYVESDTTAAFAANVDEQRHFFEWSAMPQDGTFYETIDPAGAKPDAISWDLVDVFDRVWQAQEWPCESWPIHGMLPGPWAIPSMKTERLNGEEGPVWNQPKPSISQRVLQIWEGRRRVLEMMAAAGRPYQGKTEKRKLVLEWHPDGKGGFKVLKEDEEREYIVPALTIMDGRFAKAQTDSVRGNESITIAERFYEDPNAIRITPADGFELSEGDQFINDALVRDNNGKPSLMFNRECTNTAFMLSFYTHPRFRENTVAKDEVCKEWRDLKAYLLLKNPRHVVPQVNNPQDEWGY